jgi:pimeloyl-ACP methyl ester carboxylesterase
VPALLARGEVSTLLSLETVAEMRARRPDMTVVTVPGVGHAPILTEDAVRDVLRDFVSDTDSVHNSPRTN